MVDRNRSAVSRSVVGVVMIGGLGLSASTLLPWSGPSDGELSVWKTSSAVDVVISALGCVAALLAIVELLWGRCRAFLVAAASAAALSGGCWAGEFVKAPATLLRYAGPPVALGCALLLLAGVAACVRRPRGLTVGSGRAVMVGRVVLVVAAVATPALPVITGIGGVSLYAQSSVIDIGLVVLSTVVLVSALLLPRRWPMTWAAIIAGAGVTALAYATGLELLLTEQDALFDSDATGFVLAFIAAPLAAVGTVLLAAAADEATYGAARTAAVGEPGTAASRSQ